MVTATAPASHMATQPQPAALVTPSPSFLSRCREDLSPEKATNLDWWSNTYYYAFLGGGTALYIAAAATAFIAVSILFPVYVPIVVLTALVLAVPASGWAQRFKQSSEIFAQEADNYRSIQNHFTQITNQSIEQTQADLLSREIIWFQIPGIGISHPENLVSLHPLLARAKYLDDKIQQHLKNTNQLIAQARDLANTDFAANRAQIYNLRMAALYSKDEMLKVKIEAAFVNAILSKGDFNGTFEDIASASDVNYLERLIGQGVGDTTGFNSCVTFRNPDVSPISFFRLSALSVPHLGKRFAAAMDQE